MSSNYQKHTPNHNGSRHCLGCLIGFVCSVVFCVGLLILLGKGQDVFRFYEAYLTEQWQNSMFAQGQDMPDESEPDTAIAQAQVENVPVLQAAEDLLQQLETETGMVSDEIYRYGYTTLTTAEKITYLTTASCAFTMTEQVEIPPQGSANLEKVWPIVRSDFPEMFWVESSVTRTITTGAKQEVWFIPSYSLTATQRAAQEAEIAQTANRYFTSIATDATDYQKVQAAYEFVVLNTSYTSTPNDQTIYGCLGQGQAVCAGYARAIQYLLGRVGVACAYLSGDAISADDGVAITHAWNFVVLDGEYYYLDATWGEDNWDTGVDYSYLCVNDADLATTHFVNDRYPLPAVMGTVYNYYRMQGAYLENYSYTAAQSALQAQGIADCYTLRFADGTTLRNALDDLIEGGEIYDIFRSMGVSSTSISYTFKENVNTLTIYPE